MLELRWSDAPNSPADLGWSNVVTPLGATVQVPTNSPTFDACTEWSLLNSGRGALCPTRPQEWFDAGELAEIPTGLVAELHASVLEMAEFVRIIASDADARGHILRLPEHAFGADPDERQLLSECVEIAQRLEALEAARDAVNEVLGR